MAANGEDFRSRFKESSKWQKMRVSRSVSKKISKRKTFKIFGAVLRRLNHLVLATCRVESSQQHTDQGCKQQASTLQISHPRQSKSQTATAKCAKTPYKEFWNSMRNNIFQSIFLSSKSKRTKLLRTALKHDPRHRNKTCISVG